MDFRDIEIIVTVSKCKSFYDAAVMLNYSPSVISKSIARVEKEVGVVLFERGNRASATSLTKKGAALMPSLTIIYDSMSQFKRDLCAMQSDNEVLLKIGVSTHLSNLCRDMIISDFVEKHPEVRIEQYYRDFDTLVNMLYSESVDGIFVIVQSGSRNMNVLNNIFSDPKVESYILSSDSLMFLGISEKDPLAKESEAPFIAFRDYSIMIHPEKEIVVNAGVLDPFNELSKRSGFELKTVFLDPHETSSHYLATKMKIAIPIKGSSFIYPGIKFIRVTDWDTLSLSCFLAHKTNSSKAVANLKKSVQDFISLHPVTCFDEH